MADQDQDKQQDVAGDRRRIEEDPRLTDVQFFLMALPGIAGAIVAKSSDPTSGSSLAVAATRELCGHVISLGLVRPTYLTPDNQPLGIIAAGMGGVQGTNPLGAPVGNDGRMIKQFPTNHGAVHRGG
jgi:hypothetical protein